MTIEIEGGRTHLWQWDLNQKIVLTGVEPGSAVHFGRPDGGAYVVIAYEQDGKVMADVPNIWLQLCGDLHVYIYCNCRETRCHENIFVAPRQRPDSYAYTETEILSCEALDARLKRQEERPIPSDVVQYTQQQLTEAQKAQARKNIGATAATTEPSYVNTDIKIIDAGLTYNRGILAVKKIGEILWVIDSGVYNITDSFKTQNNHTCFEFKLPKELSDLIPNVNGAYGATGTIGYFPALAYENTTYTTFNCQSYLKRSAIGENEDTFQMVYTGLGAVKAGSGLCGFHLRMPVLLC